MNLSKEHLKRAKQEAQEKAKGFFDVETIFVGVFCLLASFFAALILSGTKFSFETFKNPKFYISTAISFGLMMYSYNFSKSVFVRKLKETPKGKYQEAEERERKIQKYVYDWHLQDKIKEAAEKETELNRKTAAQALLDSVTYGLDVDDIEDLDNPRNIVTNKFAFDDFVKKRQLRSRKFFLFFWQKNEIGKLRKVLRKVLNGRYKYQVVDFRDLIGDPSASKQEQRQYKIDELKLNLKENRKKTMMFIVSTVLSNILMWQGFNKTFLLAMFSQVMLIFSSILSGYTVALSRVKLLTIVMQNRNDLNYRALQDNLKKIPLGVGPADLKIEPVVEAKKEAVQSPSEKIISITTRPTEDNPLRNGVAPPSLSNPFTDRMTALNDKINALSKS